MFGLTKNTEFKAMVVLDKATRLFLNMFCQYFVIYIAVSCLIGNNYVI